MTQPEYTTIEDLCEKAARRMIAEDDDTAFNEVSPASNKELLSGLQALSVAHDTLKQETAKIYEEIIDLTKTIQPTINQLMQQNQQKKNKQNSQNQNQQQNKHVITRSEIIITGITAKTITITTTTMKGNATKTIGKMNENLYMILEIWHYPQLRRVECPEDRRGLQQRQAMIKSVKHRRNHYYWDSRHKNPGKKENWRK